MASTACSDIKESFCQLFLEDKRPWLVGFGVGNWVARAIGPRVSATRRYNSEVLLARGDERKNSSRSALLFYQQPANGNRDLKHPACEYELAA